MTSDPFHANSSDPAGAPVSPPAAGHRDVAHAEARARRYGAGQGSWLLASAAQRMGAAALVCAALWGLTGWAMGWW
ncbi:hypothetical protein [Bordetella genomosp. 11]|nr:hypothetical protein [Bordetella genomosp. 11]